VESANDRAIVDAPGVWQVIPRAKAYELVVDRIEDQIMSGHLRVGDRLPPERELATMLEVSRSAVREAIRVLQAWGVLSSTVGNGPDSGTVITGSSSDALNHLLRLHVALTNFPVDQVVEARVMLERWSVRLAAANATPSDLTRLAGLLAEMDDPSVGRAAFNDLDTAFHVAIAQASSNRLVADLTSAMREALRHSLLAAFSDADAWEKLAAGFRTEHHAIYDCIASGDGPKAADTVESHIRDFLGRMKVLLPPR
jgi:GntR family transcriptional repressor for pyruvate dehydrogenase complex